jgi:hypothetical protein
MDRTKHAKIVIAKITDLFYREAIGVFARTVLAAP